LSLVDRMLVLDAGETYGLAGALSCVGLEPETGARARVEAKIAFVARPVRW
jgi:hypothetical protein